MKFTLSWLKTHLDTSADLDTIARRLTAVGLEVENITDRAADFAPFKVVHILEAKPHPDADRLKVCRVMTDAGEVQVVCGAPNARAGLKAVLAPPGSTVPGKGGITLKKAAIRGQESFGMMVSEEEMDLPVTIDGIIEMPDDAAIGTPFASLLGLDDPVIEINLTPNRADCAGVRGIARDLAAAGLGTLKPLNTTAIKGAFESPVSVATQTTGCPQFLGRYIKGVTNGPSPAWLQQRLTSIGLRPISTLVDITNFFTFDLGRPLHVFDADKIKGNLVVRDAKDGETLAALNDKSYTLTAGMTVIADDTGVINLGGIMGGQSTGCSGDTRNVYLECAYFDPLATARTGRLLQINSDARYRFERGVDPAFLADAVEIATRLILELCGGEPGHVVQAGQAPFTPRSVSFRPARTAQLGDVEMPAEKQEHILKVLGFTPVPGPGTWQVGVPSWRGDIEGEADLVEEIVRINGYDNIAPCSVTSPHAVPRGAETALSQRRRLARAALATRGLQEAVTWSFVSDTQAGLFGGAPASLKLVNPISTDLAVMRPSIIPTLLDAAKNAAARGAPDAALFETGPVFATPRPDGAMQVATALRTGNTCGKTWNQNARPADTFDARSDAAAVLQALGFNPDTMTIGRDAPSYYHPGRSGTLMMGKNIVACFGEIHPGVRDALDIKFTAAACEVFLDRLPAARASKGFARPLLALSPFQSVTRDFAFLIASNVPAADLLRAVRKADDTLIRDVELFDVYAGTGVPSGQKSVALSVTLQATDRTLTDQDIDTVCTKIIDAVSKAVGGQLRAA